MDNIIAELVSMRTRVDVLENNYNDIQQLIKSKKEEIDLLSQKNILINESLGAYKAAIDLIYERSIDELKTTLNAALSYIFVDRDFSIDIVLEDRYGKSLVLVLQTGGFTVSLKDGMGMGINCVISAVLHIYYLYCKGSKILLLDESYHNISEDYIDRFFEFLRDLCKSLDFKLVLISHDTRIVPFADHAYRISKGKVESNWKV